MRFPYPVTDAHVHVNRFDLMAPGPRAVIEQNPTFPLMQKLVADPRALLAHMDAEGIARAWLVNYCAREVMGYGREVNDWIAAYVQADLRRLVAVGGYDPREDGPGRKAVARMREQGIQALKFHPVHMRLSPNAHRHRSEAGVNLEGAYAMLEELGMPLMVHTGTSIFPGADNSFASVSPIEAVLEDFPGLSVIMCHGGRPNETALALRIMDRHDNCHIDLSSCPPQKLPEYFGDLAERRDRFLWGSDWPGPKVPGMGANVESFLRLGLDDETNRAILAGNAERLLRGVA